jgi:hypothetical protein
VQVSSAKGGTVDRMVSVAGAADAVGHLAETTINRVVGKGDVGETLSKIGKTNRFR